MHVMAKQLHVVGAKMMPHYLYFTAVEAKPKPDMKAPKVNPRTKIQYQQQPATKTGQTSRFTHEKPADCQLYIGQVVYCSKNDLCGVVVWMGKHKENNSYYVGIHVVSNHNIVQSAVFLLCSMTDTLKDLSSLGLQYTKKFCCPEASLLLWMSVNFF